MRIGPFAGWDPVFYFDGLLDVLLLVVLLVLVFTRDQLIFVLVRRGHDALLVGLLLLVVTKGVDALVAVVAGLIYPLFIHELGTVVVLSLRSSLLTMLAEVHVRIATSVCGLLDLLVERECRISTASIFTSVRADERFLLVLRFSHRKDVSYRYLAESVISVQSVFLLILRVGLIARVHLVLRNNYNRI